MITLTFNCKDTKEVLGLLSKLTGGFADTSQLPKVDIADVDDEVEAPAPKVKAKAKAAKPVEVDEDLADDLDDEPKKSSGPTKEQVMTAAKNLAKETSRDEVVRLLKKKFKVESVNSLDPKHYQAAYDLFNL
jgi:hypothetical protein